MNIKKISVFFIIYFMINFFNTTSLFMLNEKSAPIINNSQNHYSEQVNSEIIDTTSFNLLSLHEMVIIRGGCSGGTCDDYPHICGEECTYLYSRQCDGTSGYCDNAGYSPVCKCFGHYVFIQSCM